MKTQDHHEFQLIDSIFTPEEANTVLSNLISSKINYHNLDDFSNFVRFDRTIAHSKKRIAELNETKAKLKQYIDVAQQKGCNLIVKSKVFIEIVD